jgi:hypothetical protein
MVNLTEKQISLKFLYKKPQIKGPVTIAPDSF